MSATATAPPIHAPAEALAAMQAPVPFAEEVRPGPLRRLAAMLLFAAICLIYVELALQVYDRCFRYQPFFVSLNANWYHRVMKSPGEVYRDRPGSYPGVTINSLGFRGAEFPPKRPEVPRILALGDSVTFGFYIGEEDAWPARLEAHLTNALGREVEVLNLGRTTTSSFGTRHDVLHHAEALQPDALVISVGWYNDFQIFHLHPGLDEEAAAAEGTFDSEVWLAQSPLLYSRLFSLLRLRLEEYRHRQAYYAEEAAIARGDHAVDAVDVVRRMPYAKFRAGLLEMCAWASERSIPVYFTTPRMRPDWEARQPIIATYARAIEEVAAQCGAIVIPSREAIAEAAASAASEGELWIDQVHLTPGGSDVVARSAADVIARTWKPARP